MSVKTFKKPAINVRAKEVYWCYRDVQGHFVCTPVEANKAIAKSLDAMYQEFWKVAPLYAKQLLGEGVEVKQEGKSGGWYVVHGLPPVSHWDAPFKRKWALLERLVASEIRRVTSLEFHLKTIESNNWL